VDALVIRINIAEGRDTGLKDGWGYLVGGIGVALAIVQAMHSLAK
jgi:hypothetical protein